MATLTTLTARQADLQEKLEKARRAKKATKELRDALAQLEVEIEAAQAVTVEAEAPKRGRGRPRKYSPDFYTLRDASRRSRRGRPNREQVVADLQRFGVEVSSEASFRELEVALKEARAKALEAAK